MDFKNEEFIKRFIIDHVRIINHTANNFVKSEIAKGEITTPQLNLMMELATDDGLTVKELSHRLHLSHSTVSAIISRLEVKDLLVRKQDPNDGRCTRIYLSNKVNDYVKNKFIERYTPFIEAIEQATEEERKKIIEGFSILSRLLKDNESK